MTLYSCLCSRYFFITNLPQNKLKYKKEAVFATFLRDPTQRVMSQWRSDTHNLPEIFGGCKAFDYLFAKQARWPTCCFARKTSPWRCLIAGALNDVFDGWEVAPPLLHLEKKRNN